MAGSVLVRERVRAAGRFWLRCRLPGWVPAYPLLTLLPSPLRALHPRFAGSYAKPARRVQSLPGTGLTGFTASHGQVVFVESALLLYIIFYLFRSPDNSARKRPYASFAHLLLFIVPPSLIFRTCPVS